MSEVWKPIPGYGGHYEASTSGRVRSIARVVYKRHSKSNRIEPFHYKAKVLSPTKHGKYGHLTVHLGVDGKKFTVFVHRLVLLAFVGPCPEDREGCHNNGIASDNCPENLRWDTHYNNNQDRKSHGKYATGAAHPMAKLTAEQVQDVRERRLSNTEIMAALGVSLSHAQRIRTGHAWKVA